MAEKVKVSFFWQCVIRSKLNLHLITHIFASLDKMVYNNILCLVASNKQHIN